MGINASVIQKIYIAYFNRPADVAGLKYWEGQLESNKISLVGVAQSFSEQVEYKTLYGGKSTSDVVTALYKNLFGRTPDADGLKYWVGQIDNGIVNLGTAALAILNGAVSTSIDGVTIANKMSFAEQFTASLNTVAKADSYSNSFGFDALKLVLSKVNAFEPVPTLTAQTPLFFASDSKMVNASNLSKGFLVGLSLKGLAVSVGYKMELMVNGNSLPVPVTHTVTMADTLAQYATISIPAGSVFGVDGEKQLGVRLSDLFGNTGDIGGQVKVMLDTIPPAAGISAVDWPLPNNMKHVEITIPAGQMTGGYATLGADSSYPWEEPTIIGKDNSISASDTKISFDLTESQNKSMYFGNYWVKQYDAAGNMTQYKIFDLPFAHLSGADAKLTAPQNVTFIPVGGNVLINTVNATNRSLKVTADIVAGEAVGGHASLSMDGYGAEDTEILAGDTQLTFNIATDSPMALKTLIGDGNPHATIYLFSAGGSMVASKEVILYNKYVAGETVQGSLSAPTNLKITPLGGKITPDKPGITTFNGSNVAFIAEASIVPGQAALGHAELWIGNKLITSNNTITLTTDKVTFGITSAPLEAYDAKYLQANVPTGGVVVVKLFDRLGHEIDSAGNLSVVTNYSSLAIGGDSNELLHVPLAIIGSQSETLS